MPFVNCRLFSNKLFRNAISVSNSFNPDQALHVVMPDLGPNQLQRLSVGDKAVIIME